MQFRKKLALGLLIGWASISVIVVSTNAVRAAYNQYQATKFTDVSVSNLLVTGTGIYDANGVARIAVGSTNAVTGNLTVSGTGSITGNTVVSGDFTIKQSTAPRSATVGVTPSAALVFILNSTDNELCMSTSTNKSSWVVASATSTACHH